jgi:hypothetical protein
MGQLLRRFGRVGAVLITVLWLAEFYGTLCSHLQVLPHHHHIIVLCSHSRGGVWGGMCFSHIDDVVDNSLIPPSWPGGVVPQVPLSLFGFGSGTQPPVGGAMASRPA